jgi:hypothetical protein
VLVTIWTTRYLQREKDRVSSCLGERGEEGMRAHQTSSATWSPARLISSRTVTRKGRESAHTSMLLI